MERGIKYSAEDVYFETVTLVTHDARQLVSRGCRDDGAERALAKTRATPAPAATPNNMALAIVIHRSFRHVPDTNPHLMMRREDALDAILSPT